MDEAFNALLELDENAVINDADNFAFNFAASRIFLRGVYLGIGHQLLQAERDALLFLIEL
jgi:hypothetical protein